MGKSKSRKAQNSHQKTRKKQQRQVHSKKPPTKKSKVRKPQVAPPILVPFEKTNRILLVGEGDFSFSRSLLEEHHCTSLHATCFDTRSAALSKYPQAAGHIKCLEASGCKVGYGVDATKLGRPGGSGGGNGVRNGGWDRILFNFPHVGGLTKDVNRQVRANQGTESAVLNCIFVACSCSFYRAPGGLLLDCFTPAFIRRSNHRDDL